MRKFRLVKVFAAAAAACILAACANTKTLPRLNQDDRNSLGTIGVVTNGPAAGGRVAEAVSTPVANGALEGGAGGALGGALAAAAACGPGIVFCGILAVPAGLVIGSIGGAVANGLNAKPGSTVSEIQAAFDKALADRDLQADLRRGVLLYADNADTDLGDGAMATASTPGYASMVDKGIGAVLEVSLTQLVLGRETSNAEPLSGSNPRLNLVMTARARMVRVPDGRVMWDAPEVKTESLAAQYTTWTARDSDLLKTEIGSGTQALARQIGVALFGARGEAQAESKLRPRGVNSTLPPIRYLP